MEATDEFVQECAGFLRQTKALVDLVKKHKRVLYDANISYGWFSRRTLSLYDSSLFVEAGPTTTWQVPISEEGIRRTGMPLNEFERLVKCWPSIMAKVQRLIYQARCERQKKDNQDARSRFVLKGLLAEFSDKDG